MSQDNESPYDELLRALLAKKLGKLGEKSAVSFALWQWPLIQTGEILASMRSMVLSTYVRYSSRISGLISILNSSDNVEVQEDICAALGTVRCTCENPLTKDGDIYF